MAISKTDFMRGMQCSKMLWLDKNKPELKIIPEEVQEVLDRGNEFGDNAMGIFGEYFEVTTRKENGALDISKMIELTKEHLEKGTNVICEASFSYYGCYCACDILKKEQDGYKIYEVKNSKVVKDQYIRDVGFQRYILERCGIKLIGCYIVHNSGDDNNPFKITDITNESLSYKKEVQNNIWNLNKVKYLKDEVIVDVGEQCSSPYKCWYFDYCHEKK